MGGKMTRRYFLTALFLCTLLSISTSQARADVKLPAIFSDHMVIQQKERIAVWGEADPGERITVTLGKRKRRIRAGKDGSWRVSLPPFRAGEIPLTLTVTGKNSVTINDILVGEVWVCSGQSNMQWTVRNSSSPEEVLADADLPAIRMFTVERRTAEEPQPDCNGSWRVSSSENTALFSAVGYHFARELHSELGVPVGMIHTSWGGTPAEAWTTIETLQSNPLFEPIVERRNDPEITPQHRAATLYNAMVAPLIPYRIRGVIWYQGEANVDRAWQYVSLFPEMIRDWRRVWEQGDFPFYFVQLAPFRYGQQDPLNCAELRDAQFKALSLPNTGMAVTMDIGNVSDIHPRNKHDVGRRLALWALANDYGHDLIYSGPLYKSMDREGGSIRIIFTHTGSGLTTRDGLKPDSFEIAGSDRNFIAAEARIEGQSIVVWAGGLNEPVAVRYAWRDDAVPNLMNTEGLPASPFRTDNWPGVTHGKR